MIQSSEFIRGYSEIMIMAILTKKDSYVYEIVSLINKLSSGQINISNPSTMVILKKMIEEDKVTTYDGSNDRSVTRKYYRLTKYAILEYERTKQDYIDSLISMQKIIEGRFALDERQD